MAPAGANALVSHFGMRMMLVCSARSVRAGRGADPSSKRLWTHIAQQYPAQLASCIAKIMISSFQSH
eukprot:4820090-Karenia_brevis.AAC.1